MFSGYLSAAPQHRISLAAIVWHVIALSGHFWFIMRGRGDRIRGWSVSRLVQVNKSKIIWEGPSSLIGKPENWMNKSLWGLWAVLWSIKNNFTRYRDVQVVI